MSKAKDKPADNQPMQAKIYAPFKVYYSGPADSVTATNRVGPFDVLGKHHNFISLLEPGNVVVRANGKPDFVLPIKKGVMHVKANFVSVFLDV